MWRASRGLLLLRSVFSHCRITWTLASFHMPTQTAIEAIRELAEALDLSPETRQLAFHVHGMYVIGHDERDADVASAVAATELACRIHEVPVSINDIARAASIDPAVAERAYHELCDQLPYSVCEDD